MESIGEIQKKLLAGLNTRVADTDTLSRRERLARLAAQGAPTSLPASPAEPVCPHCHGVGWLRRDVPVSDPDFGKPLPCTCKERELRDRRMRALLERSNLAALGTMTFERFTPEPEHLKAYDYAKTYAREPDKWLIFLGNYGTGKTHLAAAIGNYRLSIGEPAIFIVVPDLLDHLRSTFNPSSDSTYDELSTSIRTAPLLILDDLGTQTTSPWATEKLFQILNYRYNLRLPTVITTNKTLDEIGGPLASRMADPGVSIIFAFRGSDYRGGFQSQERPRQDGGRPSRPRQS